jgi:hypothetical protein
MTNRFILAQSVVTARALGAWLELLDDRPVDDPMSDERVLRCREVGVGSSLVHVYRELVAALDARLGDQTSGRIATVLVDHVDVHDLNACGSPFGWSRLVALLILTFPDVRWVFGVARGEAPQHEYASLASLLDEEHDPIFDGIGLRQRIIEKSVETTNREGVKVAPWIPTRMKWCAAIDDEAMYSYLHGYVAYRNGFRSFPVHSQCLADRLLTGTEEPGVPTRNRWGLSAPAMTMEDYYLGFPDKTTEKRLSRLSQRSEQWPMLDSPTTVRHFVTSGHGRSQDGADRDENRRIRRELRDRNRGGTEATKPIAGIFSLWKSLGLDRRRFPDSSRQGLGPGYEWPVAEADVGGEGTGHSAPGLLLLIAESLIERAERRVDEVRNVRDAVRGAVLALSAQELLGPKTPTTAREALELKHRFEALAECQFGGVQYNLDLRDRFAEIRRDMTLLGHWYGVRARGSAVLNGELAIVSCLLGIYKDNEEFDEEETCRKRIRTLQRQIWWRESNKNPVTWIVWPIRLYIEFLLSSLTRLLTAIAIWIAGLAIGFHLLRPMAERTDAADASGSLPPISTFDELARYLVTTESAGLQSLGQSLSSFFGAEPLASGHPGWVVLTILAMFSGFIHLGIFIAQLYTMSARR